MSRNRTPNTPIGTCPCPFKGCDETGELYKYRAQTDDTSRQRRAGKLYMRCPIHGMVQDQEWLLNNGDIPTAVEPETPPEPAPVTVPTEPKTGDDPKSSPAPAIEPEPKPEPFGLF